MYDLIIIGAGPAGLTAGLYAGRYGLSTLILEKVAVGGQIILSEKIENFPGFPGGVETDKLIEKIKKQVEDLGIKILMQEVVKLELDDTTKKVIGEDVFAAKAVIVACGASPKKLGVEGEDRFVGKGISYCATCDGPLFKDKEICVVGGGDRALEEAIFLSHYAKKVTIIHRRSELRGSYILKKEAENNKKINFILDSVVEEISGEKRVSEVRIKNIKNQTKTSIKCEGVFIFVGIQPNTAFLKSVLNLDKDGFIITDENLKTSREGVFAAGDCRAAVLRQVVTACGDGAIAAHSAHQYIAPYK